MESRRKIQPSEVFPLEIKCTHILSRLGEYLDGDLKSFEERAFRTHISGCAKCKNLQREYQTTIALAKELGDYKLSPEGQERLRSNLVLRLGRSLPFNS
jgi:hypothetical protein